VTHLKLLQIISEELKRVHLSEYRTYSQETPTGKGEVAAGQAHSSSPPVKKREDDIEGYVDELPVTLDKSTAMQRYDQEEIETGEQIKNASSPAEIEALQGKLSDLNKQKSAISEIHRLFENEGMSIEDRISTLESLFDVLFKKDPTGGGYVEKLSVLSSDIENIKSSLEKMEKPDSNVMVGEEVI
tara:strand:- start:3566 stop:4123 length:558 start_codon:yes stop_codon:yes gene_type:complete